MAKRKLTDAVLFAFLKRSRESDKPNTQIVEENVDQLTTYGEQHPTFEDTLPKLPSND